jgi:hypothetical protein
MVEREVCGVGGEIMAEPEHSLPKEHSIRKTKDFAEESQQYCEMIEKLAKLEHKQWAHWIKHMDSIAIHGETTVEFTNRTWDGWINEAETNYEHLTEKQKKSDIYWARQIVDTLYKIGYVILSKKQKAILSACTSCDWHFESCDPYEIFLESVKHALHHKTAWKKLEKKLEVGERKC